MSGSGALSANVHSTKRGPLARAGGWLVRLVRRVAVGIGAADGQHARLREVVHQEHARGSSTKVLVELVAGEMYREALAAGAHVSDLGLFGPWLYQRDATQLVEATLGNAVPADPRDGDSKWR